MEKSFSDLIVEIRPLIIKGIQDAKVREYEQIYKEKNGKLPSNDEINQSLAILIANGTVKRDANEILNELNKKYNKKILISKIIKIANYLNLNDIRQKFEVLNKNIPDKENTKDIYSTNIHII